MQNVGRTIGGLLGTVLLATSAVSVQAADIVAKAPPLVAVPQGPSTAIWTGAAFKENVGAGFIGGVWAFNRNLDTEGFLFRGQYLYVGYDFSSTLSPTGTADGNLNRGDAQIGYQWVRNGWTASIFAGADYQNYRISPASADDGQLKDGFGVIFTGRLANLGSKTPVSLEGNYSTINNTYWVRGRAGYNFGQFTIGGEIGALGNKAFDEARYGAFISTDLARGLILQANAGYADRLRNDYFIGTNGAYGGVTLVFLK